MTVLVVRYSSNAPPGSFHNIPIIRTHLVSKLQPEVVEARTEVRAGLPDRWSNGGYSIRYAHKEWFWIESVSTNTSLCIERVPLSRYFLVHNAGYDRGSTF